MSAAVTAADVQPAPGGLAIGAYWAATPAEYQAQAEYILDQVGASNLERASATDRAVAGFLQMFSGGGGAPQDLVRRQASAAAFDQ